MAGTPMGAQLAYTVLLEDFRAPPADDFEQVVLRDADEARSFLKPYEDELKDRSLPLLGAPTDTLVAAHPLLEVDYEESLVVGVYVGARPNISYTMRIDSVALDAGRVRVRATETGAAQGGTAVTYPARFVALRKTDVGDRAIEVALRRVCEQSPCVWEAGYRDE